MPPSPSIRAETGVWRSTLGMAFRFSRPALRRMSYSVSIDRPWLATPRMSAHSRASAVMAALSAATPQAVRISRI